jgi:hypothetical protein
MARPAPVPAREAFAVAYRACRAGDPHNRGRSYRNNYAFALCAAAAVRGARGGVRPVEKEDRYSLDAYLKIAHQKMKEALGYRANAGSRGSAEYLMWESWIYIAGIRTRRGEPSMGEALHHCRSQWRIGLAAWREQEAGAPGLYSMALRILKERQDVKTEVVLLVAEGVLASRGAA